MSWAGSVFRIQWTESRLLFLPFFSNRFLFCKELGIPLVDFNIPSLSYPFDVLTTFPRKRVIFLVLCFWICICSPRFGEISALMSLSKFSYAFSLLIRIEYLTFYSCTLKIYGFYLKIHPIHPLLISKQPHLLLSCTSSYFLPVIVSQLISLLLFLKLILHTIDREILLKIHSFQWLSLHLELGRNYVLWWPCDLAPMPFFLISYHSTASVLLSFLGTCTVSAIRASPGILPQRTDLVLVLWTPQTISEKHTCYPLCLPCSPSAFFPFWGGLAL